MKISVVTTIFCTSQYVEEFHKRAVEATAALGAELETIFVNDGSPDDGWEVAAALAKRDQRVVAINLARNVGQHRALFAGLEASRGDLIAVFDGDLDEDPRWIEGFFHVMKNNNCDVVYGVQDLSPRGLFYSIGRRVFYWLVNILSSMEIPNNVATARLMTRAYVKAILQHEEREIFLAGLFHMIGFKQIPILVTKSSHSCTTYNSKRLLRLFINNVTSFSVKPLIGIFILGIALLIIATIFILFLIILRLVLGVGVPGWASIVSIVLLSSGVMMFFNGIMAIYIATIFLEVKRRPRSIVKEIVRVAPAGSPN